MTFKINDIIRINHEKNDYWFNKEIKFKVMEFRDKYPSGHGSECRCLAGKIINWEESVETFSDKDIIFTFCEAFMQIDKLKTLKEMLTNDI